MNCPTCGTRLDHPGQGHSCGAGPPPVLRLPARWWVAFWTVVVLAVVFVAYSSARAAMSAGMLATVARRPGLVLSLAVPLTLAVGFAVWTAVTKGVVERYGGTIAVARNGAMTDALIIFGLSYVLPMRIPTTAYLLLRVLAGILLIAGLVMARIKILRWYAEPAEPSAAGSLPQQRTPPTGTGTPVPVGLPPVEIQPGDWDAHLWDPDIQADIERRRRRGTPQT